MGDSPTIALSDLTEENVIILGGNSDYMARLKIKELLSARLIKPEEGHKPPIPLQRSNKSEGFKLSEINQKKLSQKKQLLKRLQQRKR